MDWLDVSVGAVLVGAQLPVVLVALFDASEQSSRVSLPDARTGNTELAPGYGAPPP